MAGFDQRLYARWIIANGWSELIGLGGTILLGWWVVTQSGELSSAFSIVAIALLAVLGGTALEGVFVGYAQARVLHSHVSWLRVRHWVLATAAGAGVAWTLGMIPSTVISLAGPSQSGPPPEWFQGATEYLLPAGMGLVLGPILGIPQALVLRRHTGKPVRWVLANALAWAVGMPCVFAGAGAVPAGASLSQIIAIAAGTCLATGLLVGAVHGVVLVNLLGGRGATAPAVITPAHAAS